MTISIIIPIYNVNKYIKQCIDSIIENKKLEIICVDDGSKENTDFILEKYKDYSNFYFYRKENGGLSSARNYGLQKARGEYIVFLDGDDTLDTHEFKAFIEYVEKTKEDIYLFSYREWNEEGELRVEKNEWLKYSGSQEKDFLLDLFSKKGLLMVAWRYCVKREFLLEHQLFFTEGIYHEDEDWTPRLILASTHIHLYPKVIYNYRVGREGSITKNIRSKHLLDTFSIMKNFQETCKDLKGKEREFMVSRISSLIKANLYKYSFLSEGEKNLDFDFRGPAKFLLTNAVYLNSRKEKVFYILLYLLNFKNTIYLKNIYDRRKK